MMVVPFFARICASGFSQASCTIPHEQGVSHSVPSAPLPIPKNGCVGKGRCARNFRLLFVNGCSYEERESQAAASRISKLFGRIAGYDVKVHYSYLPMTFRHVVGAVCYGEEPSGCDSLLANIRARLKEIDPTHRQKALQKKAERVCWRVLQGRGRLAIFLHSGAGAFFKKVMEKLTMDERKCIDVFSFGSAWLFNKEDFHNAANAVARWDPFPFLGRLVSGQWFLNSSTPVFQTGSFFQMPVVSHKFFNSSYQAALEKIVTTYAKEAKAIPLLRNVMPELRDEKKVDAEIRKMTEEIKSLQIHSDS
jgi:hypothetical protein